MDYLTDYMLYLRLYFISAFSKICWNTVLLAFLLFSQILFNSSSSTNCTQTSKIFSTHYYDNRLVNISYSTYQILNYLLSFISFYLLLFNDYNDCLIWMVCYQYCFYDLLKLFICCCNCCFFLLFYYLIHLLLLSLLQIVKQYIATAAENVPNAAAIAISFLFIKSKTVFDGCYFVIDILYLFLK